MDKCKIFPAFFFVFLAFGILPAQSIEISRWGGRYFEGQIDDFRVYNRALSAGEIAEESNGGEVIKLQVSPNNRYFVRSDTGEPFFFLAHTGWDCFMYFTDSEADSYYEGVANTGFTAVFTSLIGWRPDNHQKNAYGQEPLLNQNPNTPNEAYFEHVDYQINKANSLGLCMKIAPVWREWILPKYLNPPPFNTEDKARLFGEWLGQRYKDKNIIWVVGGDHSFDGFRHIVRAMAGGLYTGSDGTQMITFHGCKGGTKIFNSIYIDRPGTSFWYANDYWLSYYTPYSGHAWYYPTWYLIDKDYNKSPVKPVLDIEPCYENHPYFADGSYYWRHPRDWEEGVDPRGTPHLIRAQAYWCLLAGACGHTYAHTAHIDYDLPPDAFAKYDALGAIHLGIMRKLFESRPWHTMVPDQSIITAGQDPTVSPDTYHIQAARANDGKFLFVYMPKGTQVTVDMAKITGAILKAYWFNPRNGTSQLIGEFPNTGTRKFTPPSSGRDNDWVLVLDDASRNFPPPGTTITAVHRMIVRGQTLTSSAP